MIDLNPQHLATVERILAEHVPHCEVRAFGSRVRWTAKDYSDLDLAVVCAETLDRRLLERLQEAFVESDLPMRVDVLDWWRIDESFREVIEERYEVVGAVLDPTNGIVPAGWVHTNLGAACGSSGSVQTGPFGSQLHASDYVLDGIPSIMPKNISRDRVSIADIARVRSEDVERLSRYKVRSGDIVYSRRGDVERRALITDQEEGWLCGTGCLRVRLENPEIDSSYLYYYLGHPSVRGWVVRHAHGATMPNLNTAILSALPLSYPLLPEQRRIAAILGALDDKIELSRKMNRTLEAMAQAIFKSWFIDFDGHTDQGSISGGWSPVTQFVKLNPSCRIAKGEVARYADMKALATNAPTISGVIEREFKGGGSKFMGGDTLLARITPCLENGKTALVSFLGENEVAFGSTEFIVMRGKREVPAEWVYCLARDESFRQHAISNMTGSSGRQRVPVGCFDHFYIPNPRSDLLECFARWAVPAFRRIAANHAESRTLAALRDALLPKLISGEIRVPEAKRAVEEVVA